MSLWSKDTKKPGDNSSGEITSICSLLRTVSKGFLNVPIKKSRHLVPMGSRPFGADLVTDEVGFV